MTPTPGRYYPTNLNEVLTQVPEEQLANGHQAVEVGLREVPDNVDEMRIVVTKEHGHYEISAEWVKP